MMDMFVLVMVLAGFALILATFSQQYSLSLIDKDNVVAVCFAFVSGLCIGLGLAEMRILCRFKEIRAKEMK